VLHLAAPFLAAATMGDAARTATWLAVDPSRTAFDDRLLVGDCPVAAYSEFAAGAEVFVTGGAADHLTTLFPPVRPRGCYLEVRFPDARPSEQVGVLADGLARLVYDGERRRRALASLAAEAPMLADHWAATAAGRGDVERGLDLLGGSATPVAA
jgi:glutamate--cysteine ligase